MSSFEIILLYILRSLALDAILSATTEDFTLEALEAAKAVDEKIRARNEGENDSIPGIMEGIPISVKDAFDQKGADSSCGFACRAFRPLGEDGLIVALLREAGAIPFVRTNVPQGLMVPESSNITYGQTKNPWNIERTPGGSSGGEGALLAARGSLLGVGSDIGGSLRIPAHFCGLYTLKPTPARITLDGLAIPSLGSVSGQMVIRPVAGPLAHCTDDVIMMIKAWIGKESHMWDRDPTLPRMPLDEEAIAGRKDASGAEPKKKLKIGYYEHDGFFAAAPACARAVRQSVAALQEAGHECVRWQPPAVPTAVRVYYGIMSADGGAGVFDGLEGEEMSELYSSLFWLLKIPRALKGILIAALRSKSIGQLRAALLLSAVSMKSAEELYAYHVLYLRFVDSFTAAWVSEGFDAVVCPGLGLPALKHGQSKDLTIACSYTFLYNVLHYPVGCVPIARTEAYEEKEGYSEAARQAGDAFTLEAQRCIAGSEGLPVGVQIAALPWKDEMVLRVMKELERKIRFDDRPEIAEQIQI